LRIFVLFTGCGSIRSTTREDSVLSAAIPAESQLKGYFREVFDICHNFTLFVPTSHECASEELTFFEDYFSTLLTSIPDKCFFTKRFRRCKRYYGHFYHSIKNCLLFLLHPVGDMDQQGSSSSAFSISPSNHRLLYEKRRVMITYLLTTPKGKLLVEAFVAADHSHLVMLQRGIDELSSFYSQANEGCVATTMDKFRKHLLSLIDDGQLSKSGLTSGSWASSTNCSIAAAVTEILELRQSWLDGLRDACSRLKKKDMERTKSLSEKSTIMTFLAAERRNAVRKEYIAFKNVAIRSTFAANDQYKQLKVDLCHPFAIFHRSADWPSSWCLDPTAGVNGERLKLMPCKNEIEPKFIATKRTSSLDTDEQKPFLCDLLDNSNSDTIGSDDQNMLQCYLVNIEDRILFSSTSSLLLLSVQFDGEILLGETNVHFFGKAVVQPKCGSGPDGDAKRNFSVFWRYADICELHCRYFQLIDCGLETVFECKMSMEGTDDPHVCTSPCKYVFSDSRTSVKVFESLSKDHSLIGNFAKPMAIQDRKLESHYVHLYKALEQECQNSTRQHLEPLLGPYHYSSHYSNSGVVLHYLVRLPPYTMMFLRYQDNSFDIPDRMFHSIETAWRMASCDSLSDFKELIPEFFFLPEFLRNFMHLKLGHRQNGEVVDSVILPNWCPKNDPRYFVLINRQALESAFVSRHLNLWIDLIFGYKQVGEEAINAINVFHPATYRETLVRAASCDELQLNALKTMVKMYGQMPQQLFKVPHPQRTFSPDHYVRTGLQWGNYVGSPACEDPVITFKETCVYPQPCHLIPLPDNTCLGVPASSSVLLTCGILKDRYPVSAAVLKSIGLFMLICESHKLLFKYLFPDQDPTWSSVACLHDFNVNPPFTLL
uniref:BEACH domain-containing protein n=1 Tax=Soboliphyme baturini TaxID=241478 RepID=A0A183IYZ3_9BILA